MHNHYKEWYGLARGDNDRGNGDTKTNMNNHQHHPAEGISNRFDLVSAKQMITKQMLLNQSFPSETSNHNSEPLNCDLTILCNRCRREVRKIWRSRNLTVPKPPLASAVQWVIFQWFKEFGPGIMWNKTFVHDYMDTRNPPRTIKKVQIGKLQDGQKSWGSSRFWLPPYVTEMHEWIRINA